jgi:membrane-associated protease RseP (regulator of RpoE activity)
VATFASVVLFSIEGALVGAPWSDALAFAAALLAILLTHELAHWTVARRHGFALSLPRFIPFPSAFGTMGAVISLRSLPRSRTALLEMAVAGPLGGAVVAFACLLVALPWGRGVATPASGASYAVFADPLAVTLLGTLTLGAPPDRMAVLHPVALAGWVGCMLTGINLLPAGQLDGGHVVNALFPGWGRRVSLGVIALLLLGGWFAWKGWWVWAAMLVLTGSWRSLPVPASPPLTPRARALAVAALILAVLTFMPAPIVVETAP